MSLPERIYFLLDEHRKQEIDLKNVETISEESTSLIKGLNRFFAGKLANEGVQTIRDLSKMEPKPVGAIDDEALRRWIMVAKILCAYADSEDVTKQAGRRRIILTGIDAAGKTSTLRSLQQMKAATGTRPTPGVAAEKLLFLGHQLSVFDLGGQKNFREMYLASPEDYFSETMLVIFVVDIQTYSRVEEVLAYFSEILEVLDILGERPLLSIHFHKYDSEDSTFRGNTTHTKQRMDEILAEKGYTNVFFFKTSIFEIHTIVNAFSTVFRAISPMSSVLNDTLRYYSELFNLQGAFLITKRGMIISEYTSRMREEDRDQMFEEIYKEIIGSPEKIMGEARMEFGVGKSLTDRHVFRSYPTGTHIALTHLVAGEGGDLFLAMLSQDLGTTPKAFDEGFHQSIDLWVRHLFLPPTDHNK